MVELLVVGPTLTFLGGLTLGFQRLGIKLPIYPDPLRTVVARRVCAKVRSAFE